MVKFKYLICVILIISNFCSCNINNQECKQTDERILYYSNIEIPIAELILCDLEFNAKTFLNQEHNILSSELKAASCEVSRLALKNLDIITGYDSKDLISSSDYINDFIETFKVLYLGDFMIENYPFRFHLFSIYSKNENPVSNTKELFLAVERDGFISSIIKAGSFSNHQDYSSNAFIIYKDKQFTYFDFANPSVDINNIGEIDVEEYVCSSFRIDEKGKIIVN